MVAGQEKQDKVGSRSLLLEVKTRSWCPAKWSESLSCPLSDHLEHFHVYPPLFASRYCCLWVVYSGLNNNNFLALEMLNDAWTEYPYTQSNKSNRPQAISKTFFTKGIIGWNGRENWSLIRLPPLVWLAIISLRDRGTKQGKLWPCLQGLSEFQGCQSVGIHVKRHSLATDSKTPSLGAMSPCGSCSWTTGWCGDNEGKQRFQLTNQNTDGLIF